MLSPTHATRVTLLEEPVAQPTKTNKGNNRAANNVFLNFIRHKDGPAAAHVTAQSVGSESFRKKESSKEKAAHKDLLAHRYCMPGRNVTCPRLLKPLNYRCAEFSREQKKVGSSLAGAESVQDERTLGQLIAKEIRR